MVLPESNFFKRCLTMGLLFSLAAMGGVSLLHVCTPAEAASSAECSVEEYPLGPLPDALRFDRLELHKKKRLLHAYAKGRLVRSYRVALGREPLGPKRVQGDGKTPEGEYVVNARNPNSAYYKNLNISYPSREDREYATRRGLPPGGDIKIHGLAPAFASLGALHRRTDWTEGCIAVTNDEMEELFTRIVLGSPILILP